jgi:hypothetical protein
MHNSQLFCQRKLFLNDSAGLVCLVEAPFRIRVLPLATSINSFSKWELARKDFLSLVHEIESCLPKDPGKEFDCFHPGNAVATVRVP